MESKRSRRKGKDQVTEPVDEDENKRVNPVTETPTVTHRRQHHISGGTYLLCSGMISIPPLRYRQTNRFTVKIKRS